MPIPGIALSGVYLVLPDAWVQRQRRSEVNCRETTINRRRTPGTGSQRRCVTKLISARFPLPNSIGKPTNAFWQIESKHKRQNNENMIQKNQSDGASFRDPLSSRKHSFSARYWPGTFTAVSSFVFKTVDAILKVKSPPYSIETRICVLISWRRALRNSFSRIAFRFVNP